jgi:hypothetical protein
MGTFLFTIYLLHWKNADCLVIPMILEAKGRWGVSWVSAYKFTCHPYAHIVDTSKPHISNNSSTSFQMNRGAQVLKYSSKDHIWIFFDHSILPFAFWEKMYTPGRDGSIHVLPRQNSERKPGTWSHSWIVILGIVNGGSSHIPADKDKIRTPLFHKLCRV